ncbi:MAG: rRNA (cytidine-2'-O-)-methyltransferase, partial [Candidatus Saganbacteria bacterium]|nr:rRNA (cytidine-2'-O-)-methyltransferase [Candidatus Saganbacteria bacterium]
PGISDPGSWLIASAVEQEIKVEPIPGPSSVLAALIVSGLPTDKFIFEGFLPKKPGKKNKRLRELKGLDATIIIYESPFRVIKTLEDIEKTMDNPKVAICRELTKKFEEIIRGKAGDVARKLKEKKVKGEVVVVVSQRLSQVAQRERNSK